MSSHKQANGSVLLNVLAGGFSGGAARFFVAPLDVVKIRFQLQMHPSIQTTERPDYFYRSISDAFTTIYRKEGVRGLWKGNLIAEVMWVSHMALQFGFYSFFNTYSKKVDSLNGERVKHFVPLMTGAAAGMVTSLGAYPLDLLRTNLAAMGHQTEVRPQPAISLISRIWRTNGWKGFYHGVCPSIWQVVPYCSVQFFVYENLSWILKRFSVLESRGLSPTIAGGVAGLCGKLISFPLDTVKKKIQGHSLFLSPQDSNRQISCPKLLPTMKAMYQLEGPRGFYKGLVPSMMKSAVQAALVFTFYEHSKRFLKPLVT